MLQVERTMRLLRGERAIGSVWGVESRREEAEKREKGDKERRICTGEGDEALSGVKGEWRERRKGDGRGERRWLGGSRLDALRVAERLRRVVLSLELGEAVVLRAPVEVLDFGGRELGVNYSGRGS
jgi:hypothetical protein